MCRAACCAVSSAYCVNLINRVFIKCDILYKLLGYEPNVLLYYKMENPVLDIFSEALEDTSIDSVEYHPYSPNDVGVPGTSKTRFEIQHKDQDSFINYARSYLEVKCKIVGANGAALGGNELVALQNNGYSLFERAQLLWTKETLGRCRVRLRAKC